ncbi:MAG: hypothetical protein IPH55_13785 [Betaproteobacteria bacterium]|nr:hypothetical protein [Betaproteobacteria bacterium]
MIRRSLAVTFATLFALARGPCLRPGARQGRRQPPRSLPPLARELYQSPISTTCSRSVWRRGQPDSPELLNGVREELNTRELLVREAKKEGLDKNAEIKNQIDLTSPDHALVNAYVADWIKANPIPEASLRTGIRQDQSPRSATRNTRSATSWSKRKPTRRRSSSRCRRAKRFGSSPSSRRSGIQGQRRRSRLERPANFVKPFSEAMTKLEKGKFTAQPVQGAVRLARDPSRRRARRQGAVRGSGEAWGLQRAPAGAAPRELLQGLRTENEV